MGYMNTRHIGPFVCP